MNRWLAFIVAIIAGAIVALGASIGFVAVTYGVLWLYVFGDNSWPAWVDPALNVAVVLFGFAVWAAAAWFIWKRLARPPAG